MQKSILDTGPIVALFDRSDHYHLDILNFVRDFYGKLYSTLPVVTEVLFLLDFSIETQLDFLKWLESGAVEIVEIKSDDLYRIRKMMVKYQDVPMDFADATLMLISERLKIKDIMSLDKDFFVYRKSDGSCLNNLLSALLH
ncbi:PIN domain-containing protein [candidate division KSB1 bacterium]|nr:PIN domain-containing protein [candidate division KSB1 bacterium]